MDTVQLLTALMAVAVCDETPAEELKSYCTAEALEQVYTLGAKHDVAHLAGQGASKLQLPESDALEKCKKAAMLALVRQTRQSYDLQMLCTLFEEGNVPFLPLKGAVMRKYYPQDWMRTGCDIDILVKKEDLPRAIQLLEQNRWKQQMRSSNDVAFLSRGGTLLELHFALMEEHVALPVKQCLEDIWQYARPAAGKKCQMELPEQWFYCCHMAHMAKHIVYGGCGIRPFLDLWLLDQKIDSLRLPEGTGLESFADATIRLARVWFSGEQMDRKSALLQEYILSGGAYGNVKNRVAVQQIQKGGKGRLLFSRMFPPAGEMKGLFPVLQKHSWLLPVFYALRWLRLLIGKKWKQSVAELELIKADTDAEELITYLGL